MQSGQNATGSISTAADNAFDAGAVIIAANGNNGPGAATVNAPAIAHKVIGVGNYDVQTQVQIASQSRGAAADNRDCDTKPDEPVPQMDGGVRSLQVVVEEVKGNCTSCMKPGDYFRLQSGRLYIPPDGHFCLYALHATLPLLPARQRPMEDGDWMKEEGHVICPDPAGNVIMRIEQTP